MSESPETPDVPVALVSTLKSFASAHGGSATAVVEYVGRGRVRIVLVGADGSWGDEVVGDVGTARAAAEAAGLTVKDSWDRELTASVRTDEAHRLRMGGGRARAVRP
ncbi:MAG TPA: hypothetical protein VGP02_05910 [Mycobacteriales bacterium]|jgi:hypothetical protein|nr:hypothetical protein [Mycobacteriales bacterium]